VLDLEANNVSAVEQLKYLRRMPRLADLNLKGNPVVKEFAYYQKLSEVVPKLTTLDDESIGDSFDQFVEEKQRESRRVAMQSNPPVAEQLDLALNNVLSMFSSKLGLNRDFLLDAETGIESACRTAIEQLYEEPDDEAILANRIKNQNKDQKA